MKILKYVFKLIKYGAALAVFIALLPLAIWIFSIASYHVLGAISPTQTAKALVSNENGVYPNDWAYKWGDRLIEPIKKQSNNFSKINGTNALRTAMVLGKNRSAKSKKLGEELLSNSDDTVKRIGAVILAGNDSLPGYFFEKDKLLGKPLISFVELPQEEYIQGKVSYEIYAKMLKECDGLHLALKAAEYSHSKESVPYLIEIIKKRSVDYTTHEMTADALGAIGDKSAIPALEEALKSQDFYALPNAYEALLKLGDSKATPIAISRVSPALKGYNSGQLIQSLESSTGQNFGFDQQAWKNWWNTK